MSQWYQLSRLFRQSHHRAVASIGAAVTLDIETAIGRGLGFDGRLERCSVRVLRRRIPC
jgi:hypothetical protein